MVGCIGNLYSSVEEMDSAYIRCADARDALLSPPGGYGSGTRLLQLQAPRRRLSKSSSAAREATAAATTT
jgi:hypothetical protein